MEVDNPERHLPRCGLAQRAAARLWSRGEPSHSSVKPEARAL